MTLSGKVGRKIVGQSKESVLSQFGLTAFSPCRTVERQEAAGLARDRASQPGPLDDHRPHTVEGEKIAAPMIPPPQISTRIEGGLR
jgi:hypothetical protein